MSVINFYHLTVTPLGKALPKLMEKVYTSGNKALIVTKDLEQTEDLNKQLWTYTTKFFLPHGSKEDGFSEKQPIYITNDNENPNGATILAFVGNAEPEGIANFDKCLYMFDGNDDSEIATARDRWKEYKSQGHEITYWQQTEKGGWEKAA